MQDLIVCAVLSIVEAFWLATPHRSPPAQTSLVLLLAQYVVLKWYRIFIYPFYVSPLRNVPGPKDNHIFFGQFLRQFGAGSPTALYARWMRECPDAPVIRYLGLANTETLVANSLAAHRAVLAGGGAGAGGGGGLAPAFPVSPWWGRVVRDVAGPGLIDMDGGAHRAHRRMIAPCFSPGHLRRLEPTFGAAAARLCRVLERAVLLARDRGGAGGAGDSTAVVDVTDVLTKTTLDVIGQAGLGIELSNLEGEPLQNGQPAASRGEEEASTFYTSYDTIFNKQDAMGKALLALNGFFPARWMPFEANRRWKAAVSSMQRFLVGEIRRRRRQIEEGTAAGTYEQQNSRDVLTFMVEESVLPGGSAEGLTEQAMVGQLLQFMAAGHDTSSIALTWSFYTMATQPAMQDRLRAEVLDLVDRTPGGEPSFSAVDELEYLDMFVKEVLRVYPPVVAVQRQAAADVVVEGVAIPRGTPVDVVPCLASQNPLVWGPGAADVDPDRWRRLRGDQRSPYAFGAFSNGPKTCIGRGFALAEIKIILVATVRRFRLLRVEKPFVLESPSLSLRPIGLEIRMEKT